MPNKNINERIKALRHLMTLNGLSAYIVPSSDPHQSEYPANYWKSRVWISGFTGSAGTVVITKDHAGLWTDSRYYLQAGIELKGSEVLLHPLQVQGAAEYLDWLCQILPEGSKIGCDGWLFSVDQIRSMERKFYQANLVLDHGHDLMTPIWKDRPALPLNPVFKLYPIFAGQSRNQKLEIVREKMAQLKVDWHLMTTLDDICWTFNLRSNDVDCNPVTISYAVIGKEHTYLFIDKRKVPDKVLSLLVYDNVTLKPYEEIADFLSKLPKNDSILVDNANTSIRLFTAISSENIVTGTTISLPLKAIKNETEVRNLHTAMVKDGVAMTRLYRWLESTLAEKTVTEVEIASQLNSFRQEQGDYYGESFDAIVGYESNGAIIHYHASPNTCADVKPAGILLLDSGGQYLQGTTDITRTTALGTPTAEQKKHFTLVLKGHIALANAVFVHGTRGVQLDILARQFLWQENLNYGHGTGHGVGYFLNVHEPPQGFVAGLNQRGTTVFEPGMLTSNEPGFYLEGKYGIRIENLVLCVAGEKNEFGQFLHFETLSLFPIDQKLIDPALLDQKETDWLNSYHERVFQALSPQLAPDETEWLRDQCSPII